ncbi:MAG TPA: universal stress protein, partial [Flavobacteriales bacterium]|nr:universal stress protein [Flavobacteriales bacterium]
MTDILCPTDFTAAADAALAHATDIAARTGGSITLLHVLDKHHRTGDPLSTASALMDLSAREAMQRVQVNEVFREGDPLKQIISESQRGHALMVAGTHGAHGLRQSLLGADILKLVRHAGTVSL